MNQSKKCTAISTLLLLALMWLAPLAFAAQVAGTVVQLSGPLLAKKADGGGKILALKSEVEQGDTLVTEKNTYALIRFIDNSEITLRPGSALTIDKFVFDAGKPQDDSAAFSLVKGGLRSVTGLLGKRSKERFALKTPTATIGIRGTTFIAEYVPETEAALAARRAYGMASTAALAMPSVRSDAPAPAALQPLMLAQNTPSPGARPDGLTPGLYVHVIDGMISLTNKGGSQNFAAGQFGYTANFAQPPVVLPSNPGIRFTPPPTFSSTNSNTPGSPGKAAAVDCEVR